MLNQLSWDKVAVLLLALFRFGPELGDLDLTSLHPKAFLQKHLWDDDELVGQLSGRPPGTLALGPGETPPFDVDTTLTACRPWRGRGLNGRHSKVGGPVPGTGWRRALQTRSGAAVRATASIG